MPISELEKTDLRILIAEDETGVRVSLQELLKSEHEVVAVPDGARAVAELEKNSFELVISDHKMPKVTGLELLAKVKELSPLTSFILMTAFGSVDQAVQAIQSGADDYFLKPFEFPEILHRVNRILELRAWRNQRLLKEEASGRGPRLLGSSKFIETAREFVAKVGSVSSPVLILGASGTGKEVLASSIHDAGPSADRPFIAINCASLGEQLMESELFGHEKGAFTGAAAAKPGKFELASGGTLFLDEIGELAPSVQAKLLRVLQEKEFYRVGGVRQIKTNARVIAATHRPLKEMVATGAFRADLFFRLNVLSFEIPSLKERREDLPVLIDFFWNRLSKELGRKASLSPEARARIEAYEFPGNIRELHNLIERLIVLCAPGGRVEVSALPPEISSRAEARAAELERKPGVPLQEWLDSLEAKAIEKAMQEAGDNQVKAAELLGMTRGTLQYKLKKATSPKAA